MSGASQQLGNLVPTKLASRPHPAISSKPTRTATSSRTLTAHAGRERGFALLIVLWTMVLLTLLVIDITGNGRTEAQLANNLRANAVLEAEADGAVYDAIFREITSPVSPSEMQYATGTGVVVRVEDQAGKVNPNTASTDLLQALLRRVGMDAHSSGALAAAIADWRESTSQPRPLGAKAPQYSAAGRNYGPPEEPFESIEELSNVLGMTPQILARLAPHLSIYYDGEPVLSLADPVVAAAIKDVVGDQSASSNDTNAVGWRTLTITATAHGPGGSQLRRNAAVQTGTDGAASSYRILTWDR
jgi:general secretion pathway protein K